MKAERESITDEMVRKRSVAEGIMTRTRDAGRGRETRRRETQTRRGNEGGARVGRAREGEVLKSERRMRGREGGRDKDGGCGV